MSNYFATHGDQIESLRKRIAEMLANPNYTGSLKGEPEMSSIASRFMDPRMIFGEMSAVSLKDMADYLKAVFNNDLLKNYGYQDHAAPSPNSPNEAQKMGGILSEMAQNGASPKALSDRIMFNVNGSDRIGLKGINISGKAHLGTSKRPEPTEEAVTSPAAYLSSLGDEIETEKAPETEVPVKPLLRSTSELWKTYSNRPKRGLVQDDGGKVDIVKSSTSSLFKSRMKGSR